MSYPLESRQASYLLVMSDVEIYKEYVRVMQLLPVCWTIHAWN